ncbi:polysaccharide biosynthesis/export family protein [Prochlorococcus sp. AH-736-F09]|nr:polysaccharide biosynthesis/export family protein [Prochlorococcus sp. AH-736-F09]
MILHKFFENKLIGFFSLKRNSKPFIICYFLSLFLIFDTSKAETNFPNKNNNQLELEYLQSRNELDDYIIDTGDAISLEFYPAIELSGFYTVNEEGEILLPRLYETFVRGLTKPELKTLLEKRYAEFLIDPEIKVNIAFFKSIRVLVKGELRSPGFYKFPGYKSVSTKSLKKDNDFQQDELIRTNNEQIIIGLNSQLNNQFPRDLPIVKRSSENLISISDVIRKAGGITSRTDLSRIEITRDVPIGKGGGKKRAIIDFNSYVNESDPTNDIRIFDGDSLFFPKLSEPNPKQISNSILSGISPKFISVNIFGRVETPGIVRLPLEAVLSDAIDLTGPIKPLFGKIVLIRYEKDGTVVKKNISYSARAKRGSKRNPYLKEEDLISVRNSFYGKTAGVIKDLTAPFVGIYSTKKLIEDFNE